jgi:hypothetical protein
MNVDLAAQGRRAYRAIETGDLSHVGEYIAPDWANAEAAAEPPACRGTGPEAFAATVRWLRTGLTEIGFEEHDVVVQDHAVASAVRMCGRHTGPIVVQDGKRLHVAPPSGRRFSVEHVHWTVFDNEGRAVSHVARRDDLGQLGQLGLLPPTPAALGRSLLWTITGRSAVARRAFLATSGELPTATVPRQRAERVEVGMRASATVPSAR